MISSLDLTQHRYRIAKKLGMGSIISDATGIDVDVSAGLQHVANQISEGIKHVNTQFSNGLTHIRNQLSEQLGFSIDLAGFIQNSLKAVGTILDGLLKFDWNKILQGLSDLGHTTGKFLTEVNPFNNAWLFLTQGKAIPSDIRKGIVAVDKFFGGAISGAIAFTTLPSRGLAGEPITGDEIVHDLLSFALVATVIILGPTAIFKGAWSAIKWLGTTVYKGIAYAIEKVVAVVEWITGAKIGETIEKMGKKELEKLGQVPAQGPTPPPSLEPIPAPAPTTVLMNQSNNTPLYVLGAGGLLLWVLS